MKELNDAGLLRYSRQIMVPGFDIAGQESLLNATVLIVGLGGLGSPAALYLAAAGVGHLVLADGDRVDASNLQRQIVHTEGSVGSAKVASAASSIKALNPACQLTLLEGHMEGRALTDAVAAADLVLDATDNFATRFALNESCQRLLRPMVFGAAIRMEGQLSVFDPRDAQSPCYRCLHPDGSGTEDVSCTDNGVMAPLVGIIGAVQAMEAIKVLAICGEPLIGRLLALDAMTMEWRCLRLPRRLDCPACALRGRIEPGTTSAVRGRAASQSH